MFRSCEQPHLVFVLEYFTNTGELNGNEQFQQTLHVMHRAQTIGLITVHSISDAGGSNPTSNTRVRRAGRSEKFPSGWLPEDFATGPHPFIADELLSFSYCHAHVGIAWRGQLLGSGTPAGPSLDFTRALCNVQQHGSVVMRWKVLIDKLLQEEREGTFLSALSKKAVFAKQCDLMNVCAMKQVFDSKTIDALFADCLGQMRIPPAEITTPPSDEDRAAHYFIPGPRGEVDIGVRWYRVRKLSANPDRAWPGGTEDVRPTQEYLVICHELFNRLLLNAKFRITACNIDPVEGFFMEVVTYFEDWKEGLRVSALMDDGKVRERSFVSMETFNILKVSLRGTVSLARRMLQVHAGDGQFSIPALILTTSTLEAYFAQMRGIRVNVPLTEAAFDANSTSGTVINLTSAALRGNVGEGGIGEGDVMIGEFPTKKMANSFFAGADKRYSVLRVQVVAPFYQHPPLQALRANAAASQAAAAAAAAKIAAEEVERVALAETAAQALASAQAQARLAAVVEEGLEDPEGRCFEDEMDDLEGAIERKEEKLARQAQEEQAFEEFEGSTFEQFIQQGAAADDTEGEVELPGPADEYNPVCLLGELAHLLSVGSPPLLSRFLDSDLVKDFAALALGREGWTWLAAITNSVSTMQGANIVEKALSTMLFQLVDKADNYFDKHITKIGRRLFLDDHIAKYFKSAPCQRAKRPLPAWQEDGHGWFLLKQFLGSLLKDLLLIWTANHLQVRPQDDQAEGNEEARKTEIAQYGDITLADEYQESSRSTFALLQDCGRATLPAKALLPWIMRVLAAVRRNMRFIVLGGACFKEVKRAVADDSHINNLWDGQVRTYLIEEGLEVNDAYFASLKARLLGKILNARINCELKALKEQADLALQQTSLRG
ncbi:hypothetical protein B484DRAFT_468590 [Ochromonadaceae sp. CCMP2298]|nr:hypothetical protein B484DRAFT_468590 [Ochromonadaceae sp. CCMP2298]